MVPLDIEINEDQRIILISGPNAVVNPSACKQPVYYNICSNAAYPYPWKNPVNSGYSTKILIDMGDEQSLENDLSTYSSHLVNMKNFIRYASQDTLILIDEFGTGTEPMLGRCNS